MSEESDRLEKVKKSLKKDHACYVLLTCTHPSNEGKMQVEVAYEGDEDIATYLIESAQQIFMKDNEESQDLC